MELSAAVLAAYFMDPDSPIYGSMHKGQEKSQQTHSGKGDPSRAARVFGVEYSQRNQQPTKHKVPTIVKTPR